MRTRLVLMLLAGLAAGCGGRAVAPVSGRVTLDGKGVPGVHVAFQPIATGSDKNPGGGSYAITDAEGRFTLRLVEGEQPGAIVGKHRVEITTRGLEADPTSDLRVKAPPGAVSIPEKYNRTSDLTFDVPAGGTSEANFDLQSR